MFQVKPMPHEHQRQVCDSGILAIFAVLPIHARTLSAWDSCNP